MAIDVLKEIQGPADGIGKGLSTYPDGDSDQRAAHAECLQLEQEGKLVRHIDLEHATSGTRYVMWVLAEGPPPAA